MQDICYATPSRITTHRLRTAVNHAVSQVGRNHLVQQILYLSSFHLSLSLSLSLSKRDHNLQALRSKGCHICLSPLLSVTMSISPTVLVTPKESRWS